MVIDPDKLQELRDRYDNNDTSAEMENGEWVGMPANAVRHYVENLGSLVDFYDDYRISHAVHIVSKMFNLFSKRTWVDIHDFNKVVDDIVGECYTDDYWE